MDLSNKEIEEIRESKLALDIFEASLIQQVVSSPRVYQGPGCVYQDNDGSLHLKMYHSFKTNQEIMTEVSGTFSGMRFRSGKIIEDSHYFSFEAKDMSGRVWREDNVWVSGDVSLPASGKVIKTKLRKITTVSGRYEKEDTSKSYIFALAPGSHRLPFNETEETEERSSLSTSRSASLNICRLAICGCLCALRNRDCYLEITADVPSGKTSEQYANLLMEALSIGAGRYVYPLILVISEGEQRVTSIHSRRAGVNSEELPLPFPSRDPHESKNLNDFVNKYVEKVSESYSPMFGYWFRVLKESSGGLENRALVLTTCIEGIIKAYYQKTGEPDDDFLNQVRDACEKLKSVALGKRAHDRIQAALHNAKSVAAKGALYDLAKNGIITQNLVKLWVELRNKSAHADQLRKTEQELQQLLDEVYGCIELFYALLLARIGYVGKYFEYSKENWPIAVRLQAHNLAATVDGANSARHH